MKKTLAVSIASLCALASSPAISAPSTQVTEKKLHFFSPHPDDALLTFGGLIQNLANSGELEKRDSVIEVFFSLTNYTANQNNSLENKRIFDISTMRYNEDFGAQFDLFKHWSNFRYKANGFYDGPLRKYQGPATAGGGPGGTFVNFRQDEIDLYNTIKEDVKPALKQDNCAAFVLLANGSHIDHFLVREAIMRAAYELGDQAKCQIYFGEDQPYTGAHPAAENEELNSIRARLPQGALTKVSYWIDKQYKIDKFKTHYHSQYEHGYIPPLESSDFENLYKWDKTTYKHLQSHQLCSASYCRHK